MTGSTLASSRIVSLDIIRGAVMVLMAVDHVRVYAGVPPGGPDPAVFFTRWITHFCAPAFFFLAGTGAFLYGQKADKAALSRFLVTRGLVLVLLELTVIRLSWTFNFDYANYMLAGVIWSLGWCMVLLALLVRLPLGAIAAIGIAIIAGHNLVDPHFREWSQAAQTSPMGWLWQILYFGGGFKLFGSGPPLIILYSLVPWIGVMAAGYAFGWVMLQPAEKRNRLCLSIGLVATALFLVLRGFNLYGNPFPWGGSESRMPPTPLLPQHQQVSGVIPVPPDDPRPHHCAHSAPGTRPRGAWHAGSRSSAGCRSSTTCSTSRSST